MGYGHVGREAVECIRQAPDMELAGLIRRARDKDPTDVPVATRVEKLGQVDVALLAIPSRLIPATAPFYLQKGISTVDGFDIHGEAMLTLRKDLDTTARENKRAAVSGAGWDPGTDSIVRMLFTALAPMGITYTDYGPGLSMGHSTVVRAIPGVKDAFSLTLPLGYGRHRRDVYVEIEDGADFGEIAGIIKDDSYFVNDQTRVIKVDHAAEFKTTGHSVCLSRAGRSGTAHNQLLELRMRLTNPAATAQIMTTAARAATRLAPGCYVLGEIPPIDLLPGNREEIINRLV